MSLCFSYNLITEIIFFLFNLSKFLNKDIILDWKDFIYGNQAIFSFEILWVMGWVVLIIFFISFFKKRDQRDNIALKQKYGLLIMDGYIKELLCLIISFLGILFFDVGTFYSYNLLFLCYGLFGYNLGCLLDLDFLLKNIHWKWFWFIEVFGLFSFFIYWHWGIFHSLVIFQVLSLYFLVGKIIHLNNFFIHLGKYSLGFYIFHVILIYLIQCKYCY